MAANWRRMAWAVRMSPRSNTRSLPARTPMFERGNRPPVESASNPFTSLPENPALVSHGGRPRKRFPRAFLSGRFHFPWSRWIRLDLLGGSCLRLADPNSGGQASRVGRVPVPIPLRLWKLRPGNAHPTIPVTGDLPGGGQASERLADAFVAHADGRAQRVPRESLATGVLQRVENGGLEIDGPGQQRWRRRFLGLD